MRTDVEDDLRTTGRLSKVARTMGWDERTAMGALVFFWRHTQDAEIVEASRDRILSVIVVDHDSDEEASAFLDAMIKARLVSVIEGERCRIHGNEKHVARLRTLRENASRGGKARQEKRNDSVAARQANAKQTPSPSLANRSAPYSLLPTPYSLLQEENTNTGSLQSPPAPATKKPKRSPEQQERSKAINRRYRERYEQREGHPPSGMDQQANGIIARFSDKHADNAAAILDWFFDSPDPGFKRSGWALQLLFDQAPKLWRELNDKRKAVENLAAPAQARITARNASLDLELERANEILARELER